MVWLRDGEKRLMMCLALVFKWFEPASPQVDDVYMPHKQIILTLGRSYKIKTRTPTRPNGVDNVGSARPPDLSSALCDHDLTS